MLADIIALILSEYNANNDVFTFSQEIKYSPVKSSLT